ncbi:MAG: hypothetical protein JWN32_2640 [Solirubrobacterales bacterium]|nr:hypothetical protein [Solirubrobacterales bacterium]
MAFLLPLASYAPPTSLVVWLLVVGFVIAVFGHIIKSRPVIATGLAFIFLSSLGELMTAYSGA